MGNLGVLSAPVGNGGDSTWIHEQATQALVWNINHNLKKRPCVLIKNNNVMMHGIIDFVDNNNITITFVVPVSGMAYLN